VPAEQQNDMHCVIHKAASQPMVQGTHYVIMAASQPMVKGLHYVMAASQPMVYSVRHISDLSASRAGQQTQTRRWADIHGYLRLHVSRPCWFLALIIPLPQEILVGTRCKQPLYQNMPRRPVLCDAVAKNPNNASLRTITPATRNHCFY
jgi:hypothetical protein